MHEIFTVNYLSQYAVPFQSFSNGNQHFEFKVENKFFDFFEQQTIQGGDFDVKIEFTHQGEDYVLSFDISGYAKIQCDICLDWFNHKINLNETIIARKGQATDFDTKEDFVYFGQDDNQINISQLIYELIHLSLPMKHEHPKNANGDYTCNSNMLEKIDEYVVNEETVIDPRWDGLKKLVNKNKEDGTS